MSEFKITIEAPELAKAITELANAMKCKCENAEKVENDVQYENLANVTPINPAPVAPVNQTLINPAPVAPVNQTPINPAPVAPVNSAPTVVPTAAPTYTLDMLAKAGTALVDAGKMPELMALLNRFGVEALTSLKPEMYGAMAFELRNLGAQI